MIWHIFKKDVKLTWPLALLVASMHGFTPMIFMMSGFSPSPRLLVLWRMLVLFGLLGSGFVIVAAVQQDSVPGVCQDWLVRPIRRRDLVLAKLLFVVLMVQLPIFLADLTAALVSGSSPLSSLYAAFQRSLLQMLVINIPFLALASITRNLLEVVSGGVALALGLAMMDGLTSASSWLEPVRGTGLRWIIDSAGYIVLILGAVAVLGVQYVRRRTAVSRILTVGVAALCLLTALMPWRPAFAVQKLLANSPESSRAVTLAFDPAAGRSGQPVGEFDYRTAQSEGAVQVYLPLRITGLRPESAVVADHFEVRLIETNGHTERVDLDGWNTRLDASGSPIQNVYPPLEIPAALYKRIKDQPVRVEVDSWLTLVQVASSYALPAIAGDQHIPDVGWCRTTVNDAETSVRFSCVGGANRPPMCLNFFLEHGPTGQRNPDRFSCGTYAPFIDDPVAPIAVMQFGALLPFRDPTGLAHFPVDTSKLQSSQAVMQTYRVLDHFSRNLVIPSVRLDDWKADKP